MIRSRGNMIPVVDISQWQGAVNFKLMASRGVKGVIVRAGNGDAFDLLYGTYVFAAHAAGLKVGSYWFVNPKVGSAVQAGTLLAQVHNEWHLELPPMLDVESYAAERGTKPALAGPAFARWIHMMADIVEAKARRPIIYANGSFWNANVGDATFGDYDLVCARYPFYSPAACAAHVPPSDAAQWGDWIMKETASRPQSPMGWSTWAGWQFSAGYNGRAAHYGCSSSDLDLNIIRPDVWARWTGIAPATKPAPPVVVPAPSPPEDSMRRLVYTTDDLGVWEIDFLANTIVHIYGKADLYRRLGWPGNYDQGTWISGAELATLQEEFNGLPKTEASRIISGTWTVS